MNPRDADNSHGRSLSPPVEDDIDAALPLGSMTSLLVTAHIQLKTDRIWSCKQFEKVL